MGLFHSLAGTVRLELTSADVADALRRINDMGIPVSDVQTCGDLTVRFTVSRTNLPEIEAMAQRKGDRICLCGRRGLFWPIWGLRRRPVLTAGIGLLLCIAFFVPSRILFVQVEGNERIPTNLVLEAASGAGIRFGASRREVRSEKMKNALLAAVPQLQWAGVNTYGCTAVISVRERAAEPVLPQTPPVSSIVAACDGVVTSCTATAGSMLCRAGQAVQKGQVLISGYTDCGLMITAQRAEGEIFAQTKRDLTVISPRKTLIRMDHRQTEINFSLIIGKKRINFKKGSGISDATCVKMYTEYYLTLPGGYRLPVTLVKETIQDFAVLPCNRGKEQEQLLSAFARNYLHRQMIALTILDAKEEFLTADGFFRLTGRYDCIEMIGREQCEQIGDFHGKTD